MPSGRCLQRRILKHLEANGGVLLSVHSQGTVLAVAALAALPDVGGISVVSFGSPLSTLYARFFPLFFGREDDFARLEGELCSWHNYWRETDYVGQSVCGVRDGSCLPDPSESDEEDLPIPEWLDEAPRTPWTVLDGHSRYRSEEEVQKAVADAALRLG
jgi:hypothetical protein